MSFLFQHHFDSRRRNDELAKIIFFVPNVALVDQQRSQFDTYLKQKVVGLSGKSDVALESQLDR